MTASTVLPIGTVAPAEDRLVVRIGMTVIVAMCFIALGAGGAALACVRQKSCVDRLRASAASSWSLRVVSDPSVGEYGYRVRARVSREGEPLGDVWLSSEERLSREDVVTCVGRFKPLADDDYDRSSWAQGACGSVRVVRIVDVRRPSGPLALVQALRAHALQVIDAKASDQRALLAGLICGSKEALDARGLVDAFSRCGLAHLVAVSGAHLAIVSAMLVALLDRCGLSARWRVAVTVMTTGLFALFCGLHLTVLRAWLMSVVASVSQLVGRRSHALSAVCVVAIVMALADPATTGQLGFELSVLSVIGLCVYSSYADYVLHALLPRADMPHVLPARARRAGYKLVDGICELLAASLVCQVVTLPLSIRTFGRVAIVAPLANLLAAPLFAPALCVGLLCCLVACALPVAGLVLKAADAICSALLHVVGVVGALPHASLSASYVSDTALVCLSLVPIACYVLWPRVSRTLLVRVCMACLVAAGAVFVKWRFLAPARIVVLDVGQGDAVLVQDGAHAILVDAGPGDAVVAALGRNHVLHLDAVVLTHLHDDHYGGVEHLDEAVTCDAVIVAEGVRSKMIPEVEAWCRDLVGEHTLELSYGDTLHVGGYEARMIWPRAAVSGSENADSIELTVSYAQGNRHLSALLTGDAERDETGSCIDARDVGDVDLLKVGHHGSEVSVTPEQATMLAPEVSIASAGEGNKYGHPTRVCIEALEGADSRFLCTKDVGDVEVRPGREGVLVRCARGP